MHTITTDDDIDNICRTLRRRTMIITIYSMACIIKEPFARTRGYAMESTKIAVSGTVQTSCFLYLRSVNVWKLRWELNYSFFSLLSALRLCFSAIQLFKRTVNYICWNSIYWEAVEYQCWVFIVCISLDRKKRSRTQKETSIFKCRKFQQCA